MEEKILITGCAGFIGFHVCKKLLNMGSFIIGLDNLNDYYDVGLKKARLEELNKFSKNNCKGEFLFFKADLKDENSLKNISKVLIPKKVIHLAAQTGVRHSIENPNAYINSNLVSCLSEKSFHSNLYRKRVCINIENVQGIFFSKEM